MEFGQTKESAILSHDARTRRVATLMPLLPHEPLKAYAWEFLTGQKP
jgi:hypothetical protein